MTATKQPTKRDDYEGLLREARVGFQQHNMIPITGRWFHPSSSCNYQAQGCLSMGIAAGRQTLPLPTFEEFKTESVVKHSYVDKYLGEYGSFWLDGVVDGWDGNGSYLEQSPGAYDDCDLDDDAYLDARAAYADGYTLGRMGREQILIPYQNGEKTF